MSSTRAIRRRKEREAPFKHGKPLLVKEFIDPDHDDQVVRRWELLGILQWIESHERNRTSRWQRFKRWITKQPIMPPAVTSMNMQRLATWQSRLPNRADGDDVREQKATIDASGNIVKLEA